MGYQFTTGGHREPERSWEVEEARMGQILALRKFLARVPRPESPPINLDGLMDGMTRGATEVLPREFAEKLDRQTIEVHLREIRRMGRQVAEKLVRDIREDERYWPPDPQHPLGIHVLLNTEGGAEELLRQMLRTSDPGITAAEAARLIDPDDPRDGVSELDLQEALAEFLGHNRQAREYQAMLSQMAEGPGDPKATGEGEVPPEGEAPREAPRPKARPRAKGKSRGSASTTTTSTPS